MLSGRHGVIPKPDVAGPRIDGIHSEVEIASGRDAAMIGRGIRDLEHPLRGILSGWEAVLVGLGEPRGHEHRGTCVGEVVRVAAHGLLGLPLPERRERDLAKMGEGLDRLGLVRIQDLLPLRVVASARAQADCESTGEDNRSAQPARRASPRLERAQAES